MTLIEQTVTLLVVLGVVLLVPRLLRALRNGGEGEIWRQADAELEREFPDWNAVDGEQP